MIYTLLELAYIEQSKTWRTVLIVKRGSVSHISPGLAPAPPGVNSFSVVFVDREEENL